MPRVRLLLILVPVLALLYCIRTMRTLHMEPWAPEHIGSFTGKAKSAAVPSAKTANLVPLEAHIMSKCGDARVRQKSTEVGRFDEPPDSWLTRTALSPA